MKLLTSDELPGQENRIQRNHLEKQHYNILVVLSLGVSDLLAISIAFSFAFIIRFKWLPYAAPYSTETYSSLIGIIIPIWIVIFLAFQLYNQHNLFGGLSEYSQIFNAISFGMVVLIGLIFFIRGEAQISRGWLLISWFLSLFLMLLMRFLIRRGMYYLRRKGFMLSPALVIGANNEGLAIGEQIKDWVTSGLSLVGYMDEHLTPGSKVNHGYPVLGRLNDLDKIIEKYHIQEVIISPTALSRDQLLCIFQEYSTHPNMNLRLSSGLFEILTTGLRVKEIAFVPLIEMNPVRISGVEAIIKALLDYCLTVPLLILSSPVLLAIAWFIKKDSAGPVIYRRKVMGLNGEQFDAFKFRTMYLNSELLLADRPDLQAELAENYKLKDDPRVTRVGAFLRKYSLDELPQLLNVLFGQMSLVGPRMISPPEMEKYSHWSQNLLTVKPGLTGMWQVSGRSDISYEDRVRLDMYYIRNWTVWLDLFLLFKTPFTVIQNKGAY